MGPVISFLSADWKSFAAKHQARDKKMAYNQYLPKNESRKIHRDIVFGAQVSGFAAYNLGSVSGNGFSGDGICRHISTRRCRRSALL